MGTFGSIHSILELVDRPNSFRRTSIPFSVINTNMFLLIDVARSSDEREKHEWG